MEHIIHRTLLEIKVGQWSFSERSQHLTSQNLVFNATIKLRTV